MHHHLQKCSPTTGNYTKSLGKTLPSNPVRRLPRPTTALAAPWIDPHEIAVCASTTRRRAWTQGNGKSLFGGPFSSFESSRWINTMVAADFPGSPLDERPGYSAGPLNGTSNGVGTTSNGRGHGHGHKKSLSIVSMGPSSIGTEQHGEAASAKPQRPARGHARASSLQIVPRGGNSIAGPRSASHLQRTYTSHPSPLFNSSYPPDRSINSDRSGASTVPHTPVAGASVTSPQANDRLSEFRFPMAPPPQPDHGSAPPEPVTDSWASPALGSAENGVLPKRPKDPVPTINEHGVAPAARVLSTTSVAGTPRSSGEFYSVSNNSTETLASEYVTQQPLRGHGRPPHIRRPSNLSIQYSQKVPETLMMGYAQVQGSFTLDGSLVDLGPFEQVKRKAVVGGHGGGVVGVETKRDSGLLRGFGWGSLTSSIGELLGGGELSSIKEMRGIASSKSIPLLSTPQSILFVDLKLGPGESKTYEYAFKLPKGLPPTHRGKVMKISYSLVIGTQRPGGAKEQQVTSVEIPFRVLGSVNDHGEILGHDLMSPYIILRDQARVQSISKPHNQPNSTPKDNQPESIITPASTLNSFLAYADELLSQRSNDPNTGLLSPSATVPSSRRPSTLSLYNHPTSPTPKEAIDLAILRSNLVSSSSQSANRFEIARNGRRVGVVTLARPAYRLGESVTLAIDFSNADILCLAVHAALETAERITEPALALRSEASVHRVSRKVHVSSSEATMYARRVVFTPTIPVNATPEFVTTGVALEWKVRLEFVVPVGDEMQRQPSPSQQQIGMGDIEEEEEGREDERLNSDDPPKRGISQERKSPPHPLLEEVARDDRGGLILVAAENLACESFEVAVPLRVYGAVCTGLERLERDEALEDGLVV